MKKQSLGWLALLWAVVLSVGFISCDKDDDGEDYKPHEDAYENGLPGGGSEDGNQNGDSGTEAGGGLGIVGSWKHTFSSGYVIYTFNADGTGSEIEVDYADGNHASNFSYVYDEKEGMVVILYDDGYTETLEVLFVNPDVIYLDGDKLTRQEDGSGTEDGTVPGIVGSWKHTFSSGYVIYTFNADGTGSEIEVDYADGNHASNFSYVYNGEEGVVVILYDDGYEETLEVLFVSSDVIYLDGDKLTRQ